jgi:hypothetical protein
MKSFSNELPLVLLGWRCYKKVTSATPNAVTGLGPDAITAASLTRSGTIATFTATAAHRLKTGQEVNINAGVANPPYNVIKARITVTSPTTFTYQLPYEPAANASGTITATYDSHAQLAYIIADAENAAVVSFGPDANADFGLPAGVTSMPLTMPGGAKFDLADWSFKSASASQVVWILFV